MAKMGRPTTYNPVYADQMIQFFSPPYYLVKDMTITKPDGTTIDKTELEPLPPIFLSDFARSIGVSCVHYSQIFRQWADKNKDFNEALKRCKELEVERIRVNTSLGLYNASFSIFTLKNIAGWRDVQEVNQNINGTIKTENIHKIIAELKSNLSENRITPDLLFAGGRIHEG